MRKKAFTLVEILVVVSIVGMLLALLMPAIQSARESSRRTYCQNNMRQIGLAVQSRESRTKAYPGLWRDITTPSGGKHRVSWHFDVLNDIDQEQMRNEVMDAVLKEHAFTTDPTIEVFMCPTDQFLPEAGAVSYFANGGQVDIAGHDWHANGFFLPAKGNRGNLYCDTRTPKYLTSSHIEDGLSNTVMVAERANTRSHDREPFTWLLQEHEIDAAFVYDDEPGPFDHPDRMEGMEIDVNGNGIPDYLFQLSDDRGASVAKWPQLADPSSKHFGGFLVVFGDGHTRFISDAIDYPAFQVMCASNDSEAFKPGVCP